MCACVFRQDLAINNPKIDKKNATQPNQNPFLQENVYIAETMSIPIPFIRTSIEHTKQYFCLRISK